MLHQNFKENVLYLNLKLIIGIFYNSKYNSNDSLLHLYSKVFFKYNSNRDIILKVKIFL